MEEIDKVYGESYFEYLKNRGKIRIIIRKLFLNNITKYIDGKIIDFGCGVGELLKMAKKGSVGLEVNRLAVEYCRSCGLDVFEYNPEKDDYELLNLEKDIYGTLVVCHVLEHLDHPEVVIRKLLETCERLSIKKFIIVVPCIKGYKSDISHKTYIDESFLKENKLENFGDYRVNKKSYFPFNFSLFGKLFAPNELVVVYERYK